MTFRQLISLAIALPVVAVAGFYLHELGHWGMGEGLGYDMQMSLNGASPIDPSIQPPLLHTMLVKGAGPAVTVILAVLSLFLVRLSAVLGFALAFFSLHMRLTAYLISVFINPNDEASIGLQLGVGPHIVHLAVIALLCVIALIVGHRAKAGWLAWLVAFIASSASIALVVMTLDPMLGRLL
ncbi:hypothetical protein HXX25_08020 [Hyphobacterium sp. CCMP332]|jgi:phage shock protein PspC (stress-responsive transcriptional regulator)|uniref:hypothetical protein n=1 Tax=Hyphobacterium sp. CCMP332 TaxID=2749086 RepID=UPI001650C64A|nr:hypothetical protein [Hyphobacterium sp. CCMP332]QNL19261.1 hypothetical protein HXX25_08020 [Hyphobacterium sp. CCMP332]